MNAIRTLPIRLTPVAGEALDSWLEGIAHLCHTAFGDLLSAVGLNPYHGKGTSSWIVQLTGYEAERISVATEVAYDVLETMTLAQGLRIPIREPNRPTDTRPSHQRAKRPPDPSHPMHH